MTSWDYRRTRGVTENGVRFVRVHQPYLHNVCLSVFVAAGSRWEEPRMNGISHFLEHMLFRGTRSHETPYDLNLAVESIGGNLNASTTADATEYVLTAPSESALDCVEIMAELVTSPRFRDLEVERNVIIEEIREDLDEHGAPIDIDLLSRRRLWPGCPLGQCVTGPVENASRFTLRDLEEWFTRHHVATSTVVCVSGAFDEQRMVAAMERAFGTVPSVSGPGTPAPPSFGVGPSFHHAHKPGSQTGLRASFLSVGANHPDSTPVGVMLRLIDDGMSTPLHRRIFEERGLAYNIGAGLEEYMDTGAVNFDAVCSHENVPEVLSEILSICAELRDGPIDREALARAKRRATWDLFEFQDSPGAMNSWYGEQELFREPRTLAEETRAVEAVEEADIRRVAARVLTREGLHVTTVGVQGAKARARIERLTLDFD